MVPLKSIHSVNVPFKIMAFHQAQLPIIKILLFQLKFREKVPEKAYTYVCYI